jgi:mRNA interferase MazF
MATFEPGDVVRVPFPYTDRATRQWRPALVIAAGSLEDDHNLLWLVMITSAENRGWPGDVPVSDLRSAGLPAPSMVRTAKIATIDARDAQLLGKLNVRDGQAVAERVYKTLQPMLKLRPKA